MEVMMRAISKVTFLSPEEKWNKFGTCMIANGITEQTMILAL